MGIRQRRWVPRVGFGLTDGGIVCVLRVALWKPSHVHAAVSPFVPFTSAFSQKLFVWDKFCLGNNMSEERRHVCMRLMGCLSCPPVTSVTRLEAAADVYPCGALRKLQLL